MSDELVTGDGMSGDLVTVVRELEHCPRCKREYERGIHSPTIAVSADYKQILKVCLYCLAEWIKANVPEIVDGPAPKKGQS